MKMNGKMTNAVTLRQLFNIQMVTQYKLLQKGEYDQHKNEQTISVPADDIGITSYHIQHLISEIGEVLGADKRWKSNRNDKYDKQEKLEEIADCFIVLMNVAMFSGFDGDDLATAIEEKINIVANRLSEETKEKKQYE